MNTSVKKTYYIIPVLYITIITILFYAGLARSNGAFAITKGPVKVSGIGQEGLDKNSVKNLTVEIPGLKMNLGKNHLYLIDNSGNRTILKVTGFVFENGKLEISFSGSSRLVFTFDEKGIHSKIIDAVFTLPHSGISYKSLLIPAEAGFTMKQISFLPSYAFNEQGSEQLYVFDTGSLFDTTAGVLDLSLSQGKSNFSLFTIGKKDPLSFYFFGSQGPVKSSTYESAVESFLNNGYLGWKTGRFNSKNGTWKNVDGAFKFDNRVAAAYISESLKRGRYSDIDKVLSLIKGQRDYNTYVSAPLTGNIVTTDEKRSQKDDLLKKEISSGKERKKIFLYNNLMEEIAWISSSALDRTFNDAVASLDLSGNYSPEILAGMISVYRDVAEGEGNQFHDLLKLFSIIETKVYPYLIRTDKGLFLRNSNGFPDMFLSVKTGITLYDIGQLENNSLMSSIGRTLVVSSLKLQKKFGFLPSYLSQDGSPSDKGFYGVEIFYKDLSHNEFYPHVVMLKEEVSAQMEIWTAAKDITFKKDGTSYVFTITFPRGISHHLVIKGVPPFKTLEMHGIPWNSDRRFQYYSSGWVYNEKNRTLYMKLNQRKVKERVVLILK